MDGDCILIIEDNPGDAMLLRIALDQVAPWQFREVESLAAAIDASRELPIPALAFCDLGLPDSHGLDTLRCLREAAPALPVIVVTGNDDEAVGQAAIALGAQDYLIKGDYSPRALGRCMRYALSRHQLIGELSMATQRLQSVLLDVPMVVYSLIQRDGHLLLDYCSDSTERLLGFARERMGNDARRFAQALGAEQAGDLFKALEQAPEDEDHVVAEHPYRHPDGRECWLQHRVSVHRLGADKRIIGTIIDRSDERTMQRMREAQAARDAADQAKSRFLSIVSHELRNPLQTMLGYADLLANSRSLQDDQQGQARLTNIISAGERMAGLIDHLLQHGRVGAGLDPGNLRAVDLMDILDRLVVDLQPRLDAMQIALQWRERPDRCLVMGDADALRHVLGNIFDNSIKYGHEKMNVSIWVRQDDRRGVVSIGDQGCGIDKQHLDEICKPFYQEGTRRAGGVGLGMSLVDDLVSKMNGSLEIRSPGIDQGCCVTVSLPVAVEA